MKIDKNVILLGIAGLGTAIILPHILGGKRISGLALANLALANEGKIAGNDLFFFGRGSHRPDVSFAPDIAYYYMFDNVTNHWYIVYIDPQTDEQVVELVDSEPPSQPGFLYFLFDIRAKRFHFDWDDDTDHRRHRFDADDFPPCHRRGSRPRFASGRRIHDEDITINVFNINIHINQRRHDPETQRHIQIQKITINNTINLKKNQIDIQVRNGRIDPNSANKLKHDLQVKQNAVQNEQPAPVDPPVNKIPTTSSTRGSRVPVDRSTSPSSSSGGGNITPTLPGRRRRSNSTPPPTNPITGTQGHPISFPTSDPTPPHPPPGSAVPELKHPNPKIDAVAKDTANTVVNASHNKSIVNFDQATSKNIVKNHTLVNHPKQVQSIASKLPNNQDPKTAIKTTKNVQVHAQKSALAVNVASELGIELDPADEEELTSIALHGSPVKTLGWDADQMVDTDESSGAIIDEDIPQFSNLLLAEQDTDYSDYNGDGTLDDATFGMSSNYDPVEERTAIPLVDEETAVFSNVTPAAVSYYTNPYPYSPIPAPKYYGGGYTKGGFGPREATRTDFLRLNYDKDIDFRGGLGPTNWF